MHYKQETIEKYLSKANFAMDNAKKNINNVHVHVSYGNKKVGKCLNFNLLAIATCGGMCWKCGCFQICYAIKDALRFPKVLVNRADNTVLAKYDRERYFSEIADAITHHKTFKHVRFHVAGELIDIDYFAHIVNLAKAYPDRRFWTYTKQYHIVNAWIAVNGKLPENLVVMFSDWDGYQMDNPYNMPTFLYVPAEKIIPANYFVCPGNCDYCKEHKCGCIYGQSACVKEH